MASKTPGISWYIGNYKIRVRDDLERNPQISESLGSFRERFVTWCAKQRLTYEPDIHDEYNEFSNKVIKSRLYNIDVNLWKNMSRVVFERDDYTCRYCSIRNGKLEVDHVIPISKGGTNEFNNLTTSCRKCNRQKKDKSTEEYALWRLAHE